MVNIDLKDFVSGGYYLIKPANRAECMSASLLPSRILSASSCIVDMIPDSWAVEWANYSSDERQKAAISFGITQEQLPTVVEWVTGHLAANQIGWPDTFFSIELARAFLHRFLPDGEEVVLTGIALPREMVNEFLIEEKPASNEGTPGAYEAISRHEPLAPGGEILGYEILGYEAGGFHSWLCNGLETVIYEQFQILPNKHGLIDSLDDAMKTTDYISRDKVGAEPVIWQPWLIATYSKNV